MSSVRPLLDLIDALDDLLQRAKAVPMTGAGTGMTDVDLNLDLGLDEPPA
ncbi:MAG TPA: hypothetical protein VFH80_19870 [Solirubrobacteraceae bacterium]|nr:hypothetical protein [Solirubrobacteraceae bacterium]